MLRSAATFNRTEVHHEPPMKPRPTRSPSPTPTASADSRTPSRLSQIRRELPISVRLFKD
jgi:hypothetical protein